MWDQVWDYFFGHAVHTYIQETFPRPYREIYVTQDFTREKEKITLVGGIDAYDPAQRVLLEFKTYATLDFVARDEPEPDHVYQSQAYIAMAKTSKPWLVAEKIRLVYLAKTKSHRGIARYREFLIEPKAPEDLETRTWTLHDALQGGQPPPTQRCTPWLCKFCPHISMCAEDYHARGILEHAEDLQRIIGRPRGPDFGEKALAEREVKYAKSDEQFKSYLEQHARGVQMIARWLRSLNHEITLKEDAISTEIRKDPATKGAWEGDYDIYDKTDDVKIDVKTTNVEGIWFTRSRLEAVQGEPLLLYIIFLKAKPIEVRKVWVDTLWKDRRHAGRKHNRSGEPVYIFRKDLAEKIEADWEKFKEEPEKQ
jgi:CRISPR/Cas system-associated exonuclease Cas4 (RecB family)